MAAESLIIRAPSRATGRALAARLTFTDVELVDGEVEGCRVVVPEPSSGGFNRALTAVSAWLEDTGLASVEVEFDGSRHLVNPNTSSHLGLDS